MIGKRKKYVVLFTLIAIYILGLIVGFAVIFGIPYYSHKSALSRIAEHEAEIYAKTGSVSIQGDFGMSYLIYDTKGNCVDSILSDEPDINNYFNADKYLPMIHKEGQVFHFEVISTKKPGQPVEWSSVIVVGAVIKQEDKIIGSLFLIRNFEDLFPTLIGYFCVWTAIYSLICLFYYMLEKKNRQIEQMQRLYVANVSHELKSPITSIKALMETLIDGYVSDEEKRYRYYNMIFSETNRLETTVQDILDLSKLQSSKTVNKQVVSVSELFLQICERFSIISSDIDIQFYPPSIDMNTLPKLYTNLEHVSKLLDILLHNAVKFTSENGSIWLGISIEKGKIIVSVRDSGCGISKDDLPHIFERFYKADTSHNSQGSGLGLSIAKEIIDGLNEKIWVESQPDKGTTFFFTLSIK